MEHRKYLIIGGGLAADAAIRGIREVDHTGSILAVSDEDDPPIIGRPCRRRYGRAALSIRFGATPS